MARFFRFMILSRYKPFLLFSPSFISFHLATLEFSRQKSEPRIIPKLAPVAVILIHLLQIFIAKLFCSDYADSIIFLDIQQIIVSADNV